MTTDLPETRTDSETALFSGAIVTAAISLLPYLNVFILPAYVIGAVAAVWFATRAGRPLALREGAKLGFLSTLLGVVVAAVIGDFIWVLFDYQLWQAQNAQLVLAIARGFAGPVTLDTMSSAFAAQAVKPFQWYVLLFQVAGIAILCGIFGTLSGLIAAKIRRPKIIR